MIGLYAENARTFLLVSSIATTLVFAIPLFFTPLAWARMLRFEIPSHTDLAIYFGRCLGAFALVANALALRAALTGTAIVFVFELGLAFSILMVLVHGYGGYMKIQPMTETVETGFWLLFAALYVLFFPVAG